MKKTLISLVALMMALPVMAADNCAYSPLQNLIRNVRDAKELGELTLVIDKNTLELKQWDVLDVQKIKSTVSLFDIKQNLPIDKKIFLFHNPYKN